jgi:hypothetical protein
MIWKEEFLGGTTRKKRIGPRTLTMRCISDLRLEKGWLDGEMVGKHGRSFMGLAGHTIKDATQHKEGDMRKRDCAVSGRKLSI